MSEKISNLKPSTTPASATSDKPYDEQQDYSTNRCVHDRADDTNAEMDVQPWKQPASNERTDNSDNQITNEPKTGSAYKLAGQPARNYADDYYDQKTFA
jgi:hypothetical protein